MFMLSLQTVLAVSSTLDTTIPLSTWFTIQSHTWSETVLPDSHDCHMQPF